MRLQDRELRQAELALELQRGGEPLRRVVRSADVVNRARLDELVEGAQRLLQRRLFVIEVRVVEIDAIGLQALQRSVRLTLDRVRFEVAHRPLPAADLRGEHDLVAVAATCEPAPDDRLGETVFGQVGVRRVDEVAPRGHVGVEDLVRLGLVGGPAENIPTEAEGKHAELGASERGSRHLLLHAGSFVREGSFPKVHHHTRPRARRVASADITPSAREAYCS